jgi:transformation/transcription domain-associated protein
LVADRYVSSTEEEKDLLQAFVAVLLYIDPTTLHEIFHDQSSIDLSRVPQLSEIFPTLVEHYRLEQFFRVEDWFDSVISVADIEDEWCDIRPFLSVIDTVLDKICKVRNNTILALLYKYLNCFPHEVCSLLFGKIGEQKYGRFFAQILQHPESGPLRKVVAENVKTMINNFGDKSAENDTRYTAQVHSIHTMYSLCKFEGDREWLDKKDVIVWFKMVGKNLEAHLRSNTLPAHLRLAAEQASEQLIVIFTKFLEYHPTDLDALFSLIDSVANEDLSPTQPLFAYIYRHIICSNSIEYRKSIVLRSLDVYANKSASQNTKTFLLHNIVKPIIAMNVMRISKHESPKELCLLDKAVIKSIHMTIWKVSLGNLDDDLTQRSIDHTRIEALQLTAILVEYHYSMLDDIKQDVISFGLDHTDLEDIIIKHVANVVVGYCIANFETPVAVTQHIYASLLGSSQCEARTLVTQGLELIAPFLPNLCNAVPNDQDPVWIAIPRRILEGKDVEQMTIVFHFLVKHASLFYEYRDRFIIHIVTSLRTIAQPPTISN